MCAAWVGILRKTPLCSVGMGLRPGRGSSRETCARAAQARGQKGPSRCTRVALPRQARACPTCGACTGRSGCGRLRLRGGTFPLEAGSPLLIRAGTAAGPTPERGTCKADHWPCTRTCGLSDDQQCLHLALCPQVGALGPAGDSRPESTLQPRAGEGLRCPERGKSDVSWAGPWAQPEGGAGVSVCD